MKPDNEQFMHVMPTEPHEPGSMPDTHSPDDEQHPVHEPGPQPPACTVVSHAVATTIRTSTRTARITASGCGTTRRSKGVGTSLVVLLRRMFERLPARE